MISRTLASPVVRKLAATLVISVAGLAAITRDEGNVQKVYLDPVGIPTVCAGHTRTVTKADVGKTYTAQRCAELLKQDTAEAQRAVGKLVRVPITQQQYDALVSFTFNVGSGNLASSTLLRKLNAGDCHGAAAEFPRWNRAKGRVLPGLTTRRAHERASFEEDCQ
jgi:lysozyme